MLSQRTPPAPPSCSRSGPDHTGWAMRRALRPGFFQKVSRTSVVEHYGFKTLMYGVLLPGPDIGAQGCADEMRAARDAGFECGIHTWDHVLLAGRRAQPRRAAGPTRMMRKAEQRYAAGVRPGAAHPRRGRLADERARLRAPRHGRATPTPPTAARMLREDGALADPRRRPLPPARACATSRCRPRCRRWTSCSGREIDGADHRHGQHRRPPAQADGGKPRATTSIPCTRNLKDRNSPPSSSSCCQVGKPKATSLPRWRTIMRR